MAKKNGVNLAQEPLNGLVLESHSFKEGKVTLPKYARLLIDKDTNQVKVNIGQPHKPVWIVLGAVVEAVKPEVTNNVTVNTTNEDRIDYEIHKPIIYIKTFPLFSFSSTGTIDVTDWVARYQIMDVGVTLLQGIAGTLKVGLTVGGDEVLMPTDLNDFLAIGDTKSLYCGAMFNTGQNTVYFNISGGTGDLYNLYLKLIKYR